MNRVLASSGFKIGGIVLALAVLEGASVARWNSGRESPAIALESENGDLSTQDRRPEEPIPPPTPPPTLSAEEIALEQTSQGTRPAVPMLESFDGLGAGFQGPQGTGNFRNPSDNSLAAGPDQIVQIVNSRIAVYSKKGKKYDKTGTVLYGPVATKAVWIIATRLSGRCFRIIRGQPSGSMAITRQRVRAMM